MFGRPPVALPAAELGAGSGPSLPVVRSFVVFVFVTPPGHLWLVLEIPFHLKKKKKK